MRWTCGASAILAALAWGCTGELTVPAGDTDGSAFDERDGAPTDPSAPDAAIPPGSPDAPPAGSPDAGPPPATDFRFVAWGDTKSGTSTLQELSNQALALDPGLTIYTGDLQGSGFDGSTISSWTDALNGGSGNGMFDRTLAIRGNHDSSNSSGWQSYFDFAGVAANVGATNFRAMTSELTYSFDRGNSHWVGIDVPGDVTLMTSDEIAWVDDDLAQAEARGLTHAFLYWHGPIYPVAEHCCPTNDAFITGVVNRHPIVSATFHGHEHTLVWVHIDSSRYSSLAAGHEFEELITGGAGAATASCDASRVDFCRSEHGFASVDVSGNSFTVSYWVQGNTTPIWTHTFTK